MSFPELGVIGIRSKVDTGARTSALHAINVRDFEVDGAPWVRFAVQCEHKSKTKEVTVELPLIERRPVRDSGGREEVRPVVVTAVEMGGERWRIELTLTRRDDMEFNMLLGRRAVQGRFLIDPKRVYVLGEPGTSETRKKSPTGKMARRKKSRRKPSKGRGPRGKTAKKRTTKKKTTKKKAAEKKTTERKATKRKATKRKPAKRKASVGQAATRRVPAKKSSTKKAPKRRTSPKKGTRP